MHSFVPALWHSQAQQVRDAHDSTDLTGQIKSSLERASNAAHAYLTCSTAFYYSQEFSNSKVGKCLSLGIPSCTKIGFPGNYNKGFVSASLFSSPLPHTRAQQTSESRAQERT